MTTSTALAAAFDLLQEEVEAKVARVNQEGSAAVRRFQWTGLTAAGRKAHASLVPCHSELERRFADFLDAAPDVLHYCKNERLGFSVTYLENGKPRQYYPDFVVLTSAGGEVTHWVVETKGELWPNTALKAEAARQWCAKMTGTPFGRWSYVLVREAQLAHALDAGIKNWATLAATLLEHLP